MQALLEIGGRIVTGDILTECFCCDLTLCKGICCVEGDSGAPLEEEEASILREEYANYSEYMTAAGREAVREQGFSVLDEEGELTTPLVGNAECAYAFREGGVTFCAVERAAREGRISFTKPISCHLYPIRISKFRDGSEGLFYHRWDVCISAQRNGLASGIRIYQALKEPLIRKFGEKFYEDLEEAARFMNEEN